MSLASPQKSVPLTLFEQLKAAQQIILQEASALERLARQLPNDFDAAVNLLCQCQGSVMVTGMGKAGWIAQKISATLASTGTRSHYLHPAEAMHGDLGRIGPRDVVLVLSNSGETSEVLQVLPTFQKLDVPVVSIVGKNNSSLARCSNLVLDYGRLQEACPLGLAPSTSTTVMLALGDALALVVSRAKGFQPHDFAKFHPGGSLGRELALVQEIMRPIDQCRVALDSETIREIYVRLHGPQRRSGAILLTNTEGQLTGIFTDSDLARLLECEKDNQLDLPIGDVMTASPKTVPLGTRTSLAVETLACHNISELPVVNQLGQPQGIIDITDVVGLLPRT